MDKIQNYNDAIEYINSIPWTSRSVGLHRIEALLTEMGRPDRDLKFIHVAGTNGKGSTCAMLASVFKEAGFETGLFTSPHLLKYNERMKVNGVDIPDDELASVISEVAAASERLSLKCNEAGMGYESPSEFEILTAAGLLWFKEKKCDIVVLEVGLGGEFDSTNVIEKKELAIITPLGYEHTAILGNTMEEIASAKAGIISDGCEVVLAFQGGNLSDINQSECVCEKIQASDPEIIRKVVKKVCLQKNAELHMPEMDGFSVISSGLDGQIFESSYYKEPLKLNLIGEYQLENALTVLEAVKVFNEKILKEDTKLSSEGKKKLKTDRGRIVSEDAVRRGLENVVWAARFEVLKRNPVFILDGAHNPHGIKAATESLKALFGDKKIVYIVGMLGDKNIEEMLGLLYTNAKSFITLTPASERALKGDALAEKIRSDGFAAVSFSEPEEAVKYALKSSEKPDGSEAETEVICSLGSLYLAGEIRECLS